MEELNKICLVPKCNKKRKKDDDYCSMHRARLYRWGRFEPETYLSKIFNNTSEINGCWEWNGYKNKTGYARRRFKGIKTLVHRFVYKEIYGNFDGNMLVCHKCDNPKCVNPKHLFLGTNKDNYLDAVKKGRVDPSKRGKERWIKCPTLRKMI